MNILEKIVDWFLDTRTYQFFEGNGFALVLCVGITIILVGCLISKKFRNKVFKELF